MKTERMLRESTPVYNGDPEIWSAFEFEMMFVEKCIGEKENPLSIDELNEDLNLRYERLLSNSESTNHEDFCGEKELYTVQSKGRCRNCCKLHQKSAKCKSKMVRENKNEFICNYGKQLGYLKSDCIKSSRMS
jgi:hypothetical protein